MLGCCACRKVKTSKDEDEDVKDEPDELMGLIKKDEMESGSDDEQEAAGPNQEDSDIRDMKYRLEKLITCFKPYIFFEFSGCLYQIVTLHLFNQFPKNGSWTFQFCPNTCQTLLSTKERSVAERTPVGDQKHHMGV